MGSASGALFTVWEVVFPVLLPVSRCGPGLASPMSALTVINKDTDFLGFSTHFFLKDLSASGKETEIINHCRHVKGLWAASLKEGVMQFQAYREHRAASRD